ncbi:hypothetical protein AAHC03_016743 [Spirometra sp. Aus1]
MLGKNLRFVFLSMTFQLLCCTNLENHVKTEIDGGHVIYGNKYEAENSAGVTRPVHEYLGIPFAKPPIDKLRFAPPQPLDEKQTEIQARTMSKSCWQPGAGGFEHNNPGARMWYNNTEMSEDCLYLNVWTPFKPDVYLPVMVWIFGGGFYSGSANLDVYNGRFLAGRENVVVVSMQYRLGALGFLCLNASRTGGSQLAACNMGLLDQQMALKWVNKHIRAFGGDPKKVTLFGESAGSASVGLHYLSPVSRPLFSQMIMQSASMFNRWALIAPDVAYERSAAFSKACGCLVSGTESVEEQVKCLQKLQPHELVESASAVYTARAKRRADRLAHLSPPIDPLDYADSAIYASFEFAPTIDGSFLPDCPERLLTQMVLNYTDYVPPKLLIGTMEKEGMYWLLYGLGLKNVQFLFENGTVSLPDEDTFRKANFDIYRLLTTKFMSEQNLEHPFTTVMTTTYGFTSPGLREVPNTTTGLREFVVENSTEFMNQMDAIAGDIEFTCGTYKFAQLVAELPNAIVYVYNFVHKTRNNGFPDWTGAMHGYEIDYVFGMPFSDTFKRNFYNYTAEETRLSETVMKYWANFARTGTPARNADGTRVQPDWPEYDAESGKYMEIGMDQAVKAHHRREQCNVWNVDFPSQIRKHLNDKGAEIPRDVCPNMEPYLYDRRALSEFV